MAIKKKTLGRALQYRQLIREMQSLPVARPSSESTQQIMARITAADRMQASGGRRLLTHWLQEVWLWRGPTRWHELSACLFAVVFSYLSLGAIMFFGFYFLDGRPVVPYWIKVQVPYSFVTASGLLIIGLYTLKKNCRAVRLAQLAMIIHLGVAVAIIIMMLRLTDEIAVLGGMLSFMSVHLIFGWFTTLVVRRFNNHVCNYTPQNTV